MCTHVALLMQLASVVTCCDLMPVIPVLVCSELSVRPGDNVDHWVLSYTQSVALIKTLASCDSSSIS